MQQRELLGLPPWQLGEKLGVGEENGEQVVEVVRDTRGELAEHLDALRAMEAIGQAHAPPSRRGR